MRSSHLLAADAVLGLAGATRAVEKDKKDPKTSDEAKDAEFGKLMLEVLDTDDDGNLSDQEIAAIRAALQTVIKATNEAEEAES